MNRLVSATHPVPSGLPPESYAYDGVGNRTTSHLSASHTHDAANRLLADATFTYTYDANGNLTAKTETATGETTGYTYDGDDQLIQVVFPDGTGATYAYDGLGRRIQKAVGAGLGAEVTHYVYDQEDLLLEFAAPSPGPPPPSLVARLTHGPGIDEPLVLERDLDASGTFDPDEAVTYHADGVGSIVALTDSTGNVMERYRYETFGLPAITDGGGAALTSSAVGNPYAFTGREYDAESGLYYYRRRYFDPNLGRFLQEDPVGGSLEFSQGSNGYLYVSNRPTLLVDPFGLLLFGKDAAKQAVLENFDKLDPNGEFTTEERELVAEKFVEEIGTLEANRLRSALGSGDEEGARKIIDDVYERIKKRTLKKGSLEEISVLEKVEKSRKAAANAEVGETCDVTESNNGTTPGI